MTAGLPTPVAEEPPSVVTTSWPHGPRSVGRARRALIGRLAAWDLIHLTDVAAVVVSELMTNSVNHAREPRGHLIATRFERLESGVRIEVHDASDRKPEARDAPADDEEGRGLALVDALTGGHWGVAGRDGIGKMVWAVCADDGRERS